MSYQESRVAKHWIYCTGSVQHTAEKVYPRVKAGSGRTSDGYREGTTALVTGGDLEGWDHALLVEIQLPRKRRPAALISRETGPIPAERTAARRYRSGWQWKW